MPSTAMFSRFVEVGRVIYVAYGPYTGKLGVIVDIIDLNRVLVESPEFSVRKVINIKHIFLTKQVIKITRAMRRGKVMAAWKNEKVEETFAATGFAKKLARQQKRANLSDFERFEVMLLRKARSTELRRAVRAAKKAHKA